jgi:hypothetical protein
LSSRLNDKSKGAILLVMQRLHEEDLAGHLLDAGGWDHLSLPAHKNKQFPAIDIRGFSDRIRQGYAVSSNKNFPLTMPT